MAGITQHIEQTWNFWSYEPTYNSYSKNYTQHHNGCVICNKNNILPSRNSGRKPSISISGTLSNTVIHPTKNFRMSGFKASMWSFSNGINSSMLRHQDKNFSNVIMFSSFNLTMLNFMSIISKLGGTTVHLNWSLSVTISWLSIIWNIKICRYILYEMIGSTCEN